MYRLLPVFALVLLLSMSSSFAQGKAPPKYVPDVMILVFPSMEGSGESVSCTYNDPRVTKADAKRDVDTFAAFTRQNVAGVKVTSTSLPPSKDVQTSAEFQAAGLVDYSNGRFALEPFINTFKRFRNIEIDYIVSQQFRFRGLTKYDSQYVSVRMDQPYRYRVVVKDSAFSSLALPVTQVVKPRPKPIKGPSMGVLAVFALFIAGAVGGVVFLAVGRLSKPKPE